jgi:ATP-binding cassette subfamily C (CFTR/MRP) protein 5
MYGAILLMFALAMSTKALNDWWLGFMVGKGDGQTHPPGTGAGSINDNPRRSYYLLVFGMTALLMLVLQVLRGWWFNWATLRSSLRLHDRVFARVISAPMAFFDTTPLGRVLNRFSADLDRADVALPFDLEQFLQNACMLLVMLGLIAYVVPWFILVLVVVVAGFGSLVRFFNKAHRQIKRIDNVTRSPLLSHLTATLQGLDTIFAYNRSDAFVTKYMHLLDDSTR